MISSTTRGSMPMPVAVAVCVIQAVAQAQELPKLNTLVTPDSPAFVVLGVSPTEVQRPTDPNAVAVAVVESFTSEGGLKVPTDFALEVAPFWLTPHPELTLDDYRKRSAASLYRKLSVSVATSARPPPPDAPDQPPAPRLGVGLRTRLSDGEPEDFGPCQAELDRFGLMIAGLVAIADPRPSSHAEVESLRRRLEAANIASLDRAMAEKDCVARASARRGFVADLALASAFDFNSATFGSGKLSHLSAWLALSYLARELSFIGLLRGQGILVEDSGWATAADMGGRIIYGSGRWGLSLEAVVRLPVSGASKLEHRLAFSADYLLADGVWLTATAGNGFGPGAAGSGVFVVGKLKFNLRDARRIGWVAMPKGEE